MFSSEKGDEEQQGGEGGEIELEDDGQIAFGISHIMVTFFSTLIGSIIGFYLSRIY